MLKNKVIEPLARDVLEYWRGVLLADDVSSMEAADIRIAIANPGWIAGPKFEVGYSPKAKLALQEILARADKEEASQLARVCPLPPAIAPETLSDGNLDDYEDIADDPVFINNRIPMAIVLHQTTGKFKTIYPDPAVPVQPPGASGKPVAPPKLKIAFWFPIDLDRGGTIALPEEREDLWPRVVRSWIDPQPLSFVTDMPSPVAHYSDYERALNLFFQATSEDRSLKAYVAACCRFFDRLQPEKNNIGYERVDGPWGIVARTPGFATRALAKVYASIDDTTHLGALEQLLGNHRPATPVDVNGAAPHAIIARHVAMVDKGANADSPDAARAADPLNDSQRRALYALLDLEQDVGVIAVSGPPGTGKTAMLRAMIANQWVLAAAEGRAECPVTLVCGATNQSVQNVMGTFDGSVGDQHALARRWLDGNGKVRLSFTAGAPSREKRDEHVKRYATLVVKRNGTVALGGVGASRSYWTADHLPGAGLRFARHFENAFKAIPILPMFASAEQVRIVSDITAKLYRIAKDAKLHGDCCPTEKAPHTSEKMREDAMEQLAALAAILRDMLCASVNLQQLACADLLAQPPDAVTKKYPCEAWSAKSVSGLFAQLASQAVPSQREATAQKIVDVVFRPLSFHLAARYWEARWLLGVALAKPGADRRADLRRLAMLFPCMVSTLHSAPKLLTGNNGPLFGFLDLLIIDEAGQAAPALGAAVLSMARQAVVVGDLKQLAPVPSVTREVDARLVEDRFKNKDLLETWRRRGADAASGSIMKLAVTGCSRSEMTADHTMRGLLLREHYRCARSIINICIDLLYHEHDRDDDGELLAQELIPMIDDPLPGRLSDGDLPRGSDADEEALCKHMQRCYPLPPVGFYQTGGPNDEPMKGESWSNPGEVQAIVQWLKGPGFQLARWVARSQGRIGESEDLAKIVAIVTPFRGQAAAIRDAIEAELDALDGGAKKLSKRMTIGTVHTLQGAEKPVVLFSAVNKESRATRCLDDNYRERVFIDRDDGRLLNVAISRAQKSFILFGHSDLFFSRHAMDGANDLPSAIVGRCLAGVREPDRERDTGAARVPANKLGPMMLMVVESPHKAKILQALLPADVQVFGSGGHIRDLAGPGAIDWREGLKPRWHLSERDANGELAQLLERVACRLLQCGDLVLGTDNDAQGEAIAWHILDLLQNAPWFSHVQRVRRVRFDALTKRELERAFADAVVVDLTLANGTAERATLASSCLNMGLAYGALATRVLDNLIGSVYARHGMTGGGRVKGPLLRALAGDGDEPDAPGGCHALAIELAVDGQRSPARLVCSKAHGPWQAWGSAQRETAQGLIGHLANATLAPAPCLDEATAVPVPSYDEIGTNTVLREVYRRHGMLPSATMAALQILYEHQKENTPATSSQANRNEAWVRISHEATLELTDGGHEQMRVMRQRPWLMNISSNKLLKQFDLALSLLSQKSDASQEDYLAFLEKWALLFDDTGAAQCSQHAVQAPHGPTYDQDGELDLFSFQSEVLGAQWRESGTPPPEHHVSNASSASAGERTGAHGALVPLDSRIDADSEIMRHFPSDARLVYDVLQKLALACVLKGGSLHVRRRIFPLHLPLPPEAHAGLEFAVEVSTAVEGDDGGWFRVDRQGLALALKQWGSADVERALADPDRRPALKMQVLGDVRTKSLLTPSVDALLAWMEARSLGRPSTFGSHVESLLKGSMRRDTPDDSIEESQ